MIGPDVDILLVDRTAHRDGPMESEGAAPRHDTCVVADIPDTRNHKLSMCVSDHSLQTEGSQRHACTHMHVCMLACK